MANYPTTALDYLSKLCRQHYRRVYLVVACYLSVIWGISQHINPHPALFDIQYSIALLALAASLWIGRKQLPDSRLFGLFSLTCLMQFIFLLQQQPQWYTYDLGAHMVTIHYFAEHFTTQPIPLGAESHQPPLYYALAGLLSWFTSLFDTTEVHDARFSLGSLNYFLFSMFLLYCVQLITETICTPSLKWLGCAAMLFWPANLLHCFRISNDILLYLAFAGCIMHFRHWQQTKSMNELRRTILWMAVAFGTKNSALLLPLMLLPLTVLDTCNSKNPKLWLAQLKNSLRRIPLRKLRWALMLLALCISLGLARNAIHAYNGGNASAFEGKNGAPSSFVFSPALIEFNARSFLSYPYSYAGSGNDTLFWHMYLRSMNFGEYRWNGMYHATVLNGLLVGLWGFLVLMFMYQALQGETSATSRVYVAFVMECVVATALMRMYAGGFPSWADTRHLYIVVCFFLISYLSVLESTRSKPLYRTGASLLILYLLFAGYHILLQLTYGASLPIVAGS